MGKQLVRNAKGQVVSGVIDPKTHWPKGTSGNPKGRPLETHLKAFIKRAKREERFAEEVVKVALDSRHPAWKAAASMLLDRVDGAVAKKLELEGELPLKVVLRGDRGGEES